MPPIDTAGDEASAIEHGRVCAVATECLRDLLDAVAAHPTLFEAKPFGPTIYSGVSLANAFGSPWATAAEIRVAARAALWVFAADWLFDYVATGADEIRELVDGCRAVGAGASPEGPLQEFLALIRDEIALSPAWPEQEGLWREQLDRYLDACAREWEWKTAGTVPTLEEYLGNADNFASTFVNVSHWVANATAASPDDLRVLTTASASVQQALRLLNDEMTIGRDKEWGDLNALLLGLAPGQVTERIGALRQRSRELIAPLAGRYPREAAYLERQLGFSTGFYGRTDYWGTL